MKVVPITFTSAMVAYGGRSMEKKGELTLSEIVGEDYYKDVKVTKLKTPVDIVSIELDNPECFVLVSNINSNFFLCKNPQISPDEYIRTVDKTKYMCEIKQGEKLIGFKVPNPYEIENAEERVCIVKSVKHIHNYTESIKISIETDLPWVDTDYTRTFSLMGHKDTIIMSNPGEKSLKKFLSDQENSENRKNPRAIDVHRVSDLKGGTHFGNRVTEEWIIER